MCVYIYIYIYICLSGNGHGHLSAQATRPGGPHPHVVRGSPPSDAPAHGSSLPRSPYSE